ncbi:hypothetical protein [Janthinobacterium sp. HH01]|uniref:hypothetical protein n=1 Tax=Janthinobacterium sp. HH01 TaxID=1198452 RepID=UPI0005BCD791|nr:hypothetical protein [Janthinobacterium sp. HH01]
MTPKHLAKIKRILFDMSRSPKGVAPAELKGLALELGRQAVKRGKEPTYIREASPQLPVPLTIPGHAEDLRVGTAKNIIKSLLRDVEVWEVYLQGDDDGYQ